MAADIAAGTLAAFMGVVVLSEFTPGSISAGAAIAQAVGREHAISAFVLGDAAGRLFHTIFPVQPSPIVVVGTLLVVMVTIAVAAVFSAFCMTPCRHVPVSTSVVSLSYSKPSSDKAYRPKDVFFGRVYDFVDWLRGWLSFW